MASSIASSRLRASRRIAGDVEKTARAHQFAAEEEVRRDIEAGYEIEFLEDGRDAGRLRFARIG